ncbi:hypothetical protein LCGC14_2381610 [marine sediment metagenome]|uniref:DUF559 domain-containing protein n=1 Tax=marine sediment metagenome TaxID=412755 RepID=A0A0F9EVI6_9ZZZZ
MPVFAPFFSLRSRNIFSSPVSSSASLDGSSGSSGSSGSGSSGSGSGSSSSGSGSFPPFSADVYIPSHHVVVEIDGPQHERKRDEKRDKKLLEEYGLPVFHILAAQAKQPKKWWDDFVAFMREASETADERREECEDKGL